MTWRVQVQNDFAAYGVAITIGDKINSTLLVAKPVVLQLEEIPPMIMADPTLRIEDGLAKALLDALSRHYAGTSDSRMLREDYLHERGRVDKFIDFHLKED